MPIRNRVLDLIRVKASELVPNSLNWRVHGRAQTAALKGILAEVGIADALLVRKLDDGRFQIVDGHLRSDVLKDAEVPCLLLDLDDAEAKKLLTVLDPIGAMAGADADNLEALLKEVSFDDAALNSLIGSVAKDAGLELDDDVVEDEAPEPQEVVVSQTGDFWILGEHRLLCGDSTKPEDVSALMGAERADIVWTDPPFGVEYVGGTGLRIANDDAKSLPALLRRSFANVATVLLPGAPVYVAHPTGPLSLEFAKAVLEAGWHWHESLIWCKDALVLGHSDYQHRHEGILYAWAPGAKRPWFAGRDQTTVFEIARPKSSPDHPTSKPIQLIAAHLRNSSAPGAIVIDPFLGSGSTLIASHQLGRRCRGLEIDPRYVDVIVRRWQKLTGLRARNESRPSVEVA